MACSCQHSTQKPKPSAHNNFKRLQLAIFECEDPKKAAMFCFGFFHVEINTAPEKQVDRCIRYLKENGVCKDGCN